MSDFVFTPASGAAVPVLGGSLFPVRRIFCVGKNYADHVAEMGGAADRDPPVFFTKPADAVVTGGADVPFPLATTNLHFEGELVVALGGAGPGGTQMSADDAMAMVFGFAAGCDLTRRDIQAAAKAGGNPWDCAKAFDASAPIGALARAEHVDIKGAALTTTVNGDVRQHAALSTMIFPIADIIQKLSGFFALRPGDLIFTGTPAGVGPLIVGDRVRVAIAGLPDLTFTMVTNEQARM
ncbi:MAG: fumarylacetoacetate hydrolase family protein [Pseudomonadota bacterium]